PIERERAALARSLSNPDVEARRMRQDQADPRPESCAGEIKRPHSAASRTILPAIRAATAAEGPIQSVDNGAAGHRFPPCFSPSASAALSANCLETTTFPIQVLKFNVIASVASRLRDFPGESCIFY